MEDNILPVGTNTRHPGTIPVEKINRNDPCWCGSGQKYKLCHESFDDRLNEELRKGHLIPNHAMIKTPEQIAGIKAAAKVNMACLDAVAAEIREGMPTMRINEIVNEVTHSMGAIPAPLNYQGFPYSVCTSLNDVVCHGYPSATRFLQPGDILNVDCTSILNGFYADSSRMFCIGEVSPEAQQLVQVAKECTELGRDQVRPWGFLGDIGQAINDHAKKHHYSVVRDIGGHGCGFSIQRVPVAITKKPNRA